MPELLKAVGYWYSRPEERFPSNEGYPDPARLVSPGWEGEDRPRILAYLRSGWEYAHWRGFSYCRFCCGVRNHEMGSRCLTDGVWVWPDGLVHYVERHEVRLPDEFVATMRANGWVVPAEDPKGDRSAGVGMDDAFWIAWGRAGHAP